ncbi:MAG TPA: hypothetical protein VFF27_00210 [Bacteroidia bacterium]|nr:hypothetical protein [Bacteroidia bacterium]
MIKLEDIFRKALKNKNATVSPMFDGLTFYIDGVFCEIKIQNSSINLKYNLTYSITEEISTEIREALIIAFVKKRDEEYDKILEKILNGLQ